jgi:hypothetical protein
MSDTQTVFSGSTIEDLIAMVDRSSDLKTTKRESAALHESDGQRQSALADGSKPIRLTGIDLVRGVPLADIAGKKRAGELGFPAPSKVTTQGRTNQTPASPSRPAECGVVMVETRETHNLQVAGSNPASATNYGSAFIACALAGIECESAGATVPFSGVAPILAPAPFHCPDCHTACERIYSCATDACNYRGCSGCFIRHQSIYGVQSHEVTACQ